MRRDPFDIDEMLDDLEDEFDDVEFEDPFERRGDARVSVKLGGLEVEVEGDDLEETEEAFYRVMARTLTEAENMSAAMRDRMTGFD